MEYNNPLRKGISVKSYDWKKQGVSSYDGEDVIILEGISKKSNTTDKPNTIKLYIGYDTYSIYKLELFKVPLIGKKIDAIYIYKKNNQGKLYLSYHNREWEGAVKVDERTKNLLRSIGKVPKKYLPHAYRHEVFVIGVEYDKNKFDNSGVFGQKDMTLFNIPYNSLFWKNISLPPETKFFKKNIAELESLYGVPIETQFQYSN